MFYETRRQPRRGVTLNGCFQRRFDNASGPNIQTCTIECFNYVADMSPSTPWTEEEMSYTYIARLPIKPEMEAHFRQARSNERREGHEWVSTCRYRGWRRH